MKNALTIFVFTILTTLFYWYVGQQVPQKITYPPKKLELRDDLTTDEMIEIGAEIVNGKGTCQSCHGLPGGRFPSLDNVGAIAASRIEGMSEVDYLAESLYDPNKFIVDGYLPGMPQAHKAPISLNDKEILCVIAYLQNQGGTPTVNMQSSHKFTGTAPEDAGGGAVAAVPVSNMDGPALVESYLCLTCHKVDGPGDMVGPSLYDVGNRLDKAALYESLLDPDATLTEGYAGGVMKTTLDGVGFYDKVSSKEMKTLVDYLASMKGGN